MVHGDVLIPLYARQSMSTYSCSLALISMMTKCVAYQHHNVACWFKLAVFR